MQKYIFLDNWVYSLLTDPENERRLTTFILDKGYTVLFTNLSAVELYNPNWSEAGEKDRVEKAANFLSRVPCVIVNTSKVRDAEIASYLTPLVELPIELDLHNIKYELRAQTLLQILRRGELSLNLGIDIQVWINNYRQIKENWLNNKTQIIEDALKSENLKQDKKGNFLELQKCKEQFLFSLDLRLADPKDIDTILKKLSERVQEGKHAQLTAVRLWSLCFWYAYVEIDNANKIKFNGSDFGDFSQLSLLPYSAAFTTDGSMYRLLHRIYEPIVPINCEVITKQQLEKYLQNYA